MKIGLNIFSLQAQSGLRKSTLELSKVYERLASGMRINRASDDVAGLAVAAGLSADRHVLNQGVRNVNDAISLLSTADAALQALQSIVSRQKELAQQSANGTYTTSQRSSLQQEMNALNEEFNRIVQTTEFNGMSLLSDPDYQFTVQAGYGTENAISIDYSDEFSRAVGTGQVASVTSANPTTGYMFAEFADLNGDGKQDMIRGNVAAGLGSISVSYGNGDGTFANGVTYLTGTVTAGYQFTYADLNNDGTKDIALANHITSDVSILIGNANGTFGAALTISTNTGFNGENRSSSVGDVTGDGIVDIVTGDLNTSALWIIAGNGDGTFNAAVSQVGFAGFDSELYDFDHDGDLDIIIGTEGRLLYNDGTGVFTAQQDVFNSFYTTAVKLADVNSDGVLDAIGSDDALFIAIGNSDGTFQAATSRAFAGTQMRALDVGDINGDGIVDIVLGDYAINTAYMLLGNGDGTFTAGSSAALSINARNVYLVDLNNDNVDELFITEHNTDLYNIVYQTQTTGVRQGLIDISDAAAAGIALSVLTIDEERINQGLGAIGAAQSRFAHTVSNLQSISANYYEAERRILDSDIAEDVAHLLRFQILQKAATGLLTHANMQADLILKLLED